MDMPLAARQPVQIHEQLCQQQFNQMLVWLGVAITVILLALYIYATLITLIEIPVEYLMAGGIAAVPLLVVLGVKSWKFFGSKRKLAAYQKMREQLDRAQYGTSIESIQRTLSEADILANTNHLITHLVEHYQPILNMRMTALIKAQLQKELKEEFAVMQLSCDTKINNIAKEVPLIKAKNHIESSLAFLNRRRQEMHDQWEVAFESFSWWNKMSYASGPDFSEIDKAIGELSSLQKKLTVKHKDDFKHLNKHFELLKQKAINRMTTAKIEAERYIQDCSFQENIDTELLQKSLWLSALSVPVSIWSDVDSAGNIYDALRSVNSNFDGMSNADIWWESLFLPAESLAGLASLTKGAYFEQLVAADTGGQLYEHFNHPDTDIVIDGIAFQLKATDSASYIYSVDESIPVIATSEVAETTGVIDSGFSNDDISSAVSDALGGTIVDIGDTTVDAVLTGLGGLGFFATLEGIKHAATKLENGGDGVEAVFEGAGIAIEGTAKALVGAAEMGYNVLASRPSRFVGRVVLNGLKKLDEKLLGK